MTSPSCTALVLALFLPPLAACAQTNLLTTARQVHELSGEQATLRQPVHLHGVVTYCDEKFGQLFVQDDTGGIFIEIQGNYGFQIKTGQLLEIDGVSAPGGFAPDVVPGRIRRVGEAPLPTPRIVTYEQMAGGQEDCNWVKFHGVVRSVEPDAYGTVSLKVAGGGGRVMLPVQTADRNHCLQLVDAEVTVRGVCIAHFNRTGQLIKIAIQLSGMDDITVEKPAPQDPFAVPSHPIGLLLQYSPTSLHGHRLRVQGVVTLQRPGESLFIADETQGLYVQTTQTTPVQVGDLVQVLGFPDTGEYVAPVLQDAVFQKIGKAAPPAPREISASEGTRDTNHAALVQIEARVLHHVEHRGTQLLELQSGKAVFDADLNTSPQTPGSLDSIADGSLVRVTGICLVPEDVNWLSPRPRSFQLLLRSAVDVMVLERPSWWTARHALWVLAATVAVFCLSLGWVVALRRQVKVQTQIIGQKIQREAALEERTRIARDLHDDLGASLTHIGFLSEVARKQMPGNGLVAEHLQEISGSTKEAFQALDEIVWVVNPKHDTLDGLTSYICQFAGHFFRGTPTRCRFDLPVRLPDRPIPTEWRNHLFFAVKEALNNVRKHAAASEVVIRFNIPAITRDADGNATAASSPAQYCISIEDNGRGFAQAEISTTRNGLVNMRQRLEKIGGCCVLEGAPGQGTKVRFTVLL